MTDEVRVALTSHELEQLFGAAMSGVRALQAEGRACPNELMGSLVKINAALAMSRGAELRPE